MILSNFSTEVSIFPAADSNVLNLKKYCYQHLPWRTDDYSLRPRWLSHDVQPWLLRWNFAPVLVWNFCGDCLTKYKHDFCCETLHQFWCETFAVIVWRHTTMTFAVKLCTSAGVKLLRWFSDNIRPWLLLWNFAPVLVWNFCVDCLTTDGQPWLLLWNFAPALVWNFCGDFLTTYDHDFCCETLHQFWCETFALIVWRPTDNHDFCCETLHQFWCETFAVIVWRRMTMTFAVNLCISSGVKLLQWLSDDMWLWLLLRYFAPVLVWNFCGYCLTTYKHDFCWVDLEREWFQFHLMETANLMLSLCSSYFA